MTRYEQRIQKFKVTGDTNYVFKNELDKACFIHDAAYSDSKDLTKRTIADKNLKNRAFDIPKDPKYDGYQRGLASMVYKFLSRTFQEAVQNLCLKMNNWLKNVINKLLENLKKEKYIQHLKIIFGVLI